MRNNDVVKLEFTTSGPQKRDLRLTYIDLAGTNTTNRAAALRQTHYHYISKSAMRNITPDNLNSIVFKDFGASRVKFDGRKYKVEFAPETGCPGTLIDALSLPKIQIIGPPIGSRTVEFENTFDMKAWTDAVSSIPVAGQSSRDRFPLKKPKARKRKSHHPKKRKRTKKRSQKRHSGFFCFW